MFGTEDYKKIEKYRKHFLIFNLMTILFFTGISFTKVIPNLKGFDLVSTFIVFLIYIVVANVFVGIFVRKTQMVFSFRYYSVLLEWAGVYGLNGGIQFSRAYKHCCDDRLSMYYSTYNYSSLCCFRKVQDEKDCHC